MKLISISVTDIVKEADMCFTIPKQKTIEEIIADNSANMTDEQKAQYAYELNLRVHELLTKVLDVELFTLTWGAFREVVLAQYPTLTGLEVPDAVFTITTEPWMQKILALDWTNKVPYITDIGDCDKFANRLYMHLCDYYGLNGALEVWGDTSYGYHGFNLTVFKEGNNYVARLIEPQSDQIFIEQGPLGIYRPEKIVAKLAVIK